jgi:hypothetical protein
MNSDELARVERQVAFLFQHLGLDPAAAAGHHAVPEPGPGFGPADSFGIPPAETFSAPVTSGYAASPTAWPPADPGAAPAVLAAIQSGKMVVAIKTYREITGAGLREAKLAVEAIARGGPR